MFIENYTEYRKHFAATYISDSGDVTKKTVSGFFLIFCQGSLYDVRKELTAGNFYKIRRISNYFRDLFFFGRG